MTARDLAEKLGVSYPWIFVLKKKFPKECPVGFDDLEAWEKFLASTRSSTKIKPARATEKVPKPAKSDAELSDYARLTRGRADKVELESEKLAIELDATRRQVIRQEEIVRLFSEIASVVRGRLMKMANDLPSALLGLDAPAIDRVVKEKLEHALAPFKIPEDFFTPKGLV